MNPTGENLKALIFYKGDGRGILIMKVFKVNLFLNIFVIYKIRKTYKLINFPDFVLIKIFDLVISKTDI